MKEICYRAVHAHLKKHLKEGATLLVAVSGGPDSTALLELLIEAQRHFSFSIEIAHVDHGLRKTSWEEGSSIRERYSYPFHSTRLHHLTLETPNLEEKCREERYRFFSETYRKIGASALLLGHHGGDLAETVFKRVAEGASLCRLWGMKEVSIFEGMHLWRPLLSLGKEELIGYLNRKQVPYAIDETNETDRFLRGRLRGSILPGIEKEFGKNIAARLCKLSSHSAELEGYLEKKIAPFKEGLKEEGVSLELLADLDPVELRHLFSSTAREKKKNISEAAIETLIECVKQRKGGKRVSGFQVGTNFLCFDIVNRVLD